MPRTATRLDPAALLSEIGEAHRKMGALALNETRYRRRLRREIAVDSRRHHRASRDGRRER